MNTLPEPTEDRAQFVPYELTAARVDRLWDRLQAAERSRTTGLVATLSGLARPVAIGAVAVAAVASALLAVRVQEQDRASAWSGAKLQTGQEPVQVALADGSEIEAAPHASLELMTGSDEEVRLSLHRGAGEFKVAKNRKRNFIVEAGPVSVRVVGTHFRVLRDAEARQVEVSVTEGIVEVRAFGETRRLLSGETLRLPMAAPQTDEGSDAAQMRAAQTEPVKETRKHRRREAAKALLEAAQHAQQAGERTRAAELYAALVQRYPRDARAPLASFELGRVRMDHLGDPKGALSALSWSLRTDNMPFKQDAMARQVRAADTGNDARCGRYRAAYLKAFPKGRYVEDVTRRCTANAPDSAAR